MFGGVLVFLRPACLLLLLGMVPLRGIDLRFLEEAARFARHSEESAAVLQKRGCDIDRRALAFGARLVLEADDVDGGRVDFYDQLIAVESGVDRYLAMLVRRMLLELVRVGRAGGENGQEEGAADRSRKGDCSWSHHDYLGDGRTIPACMEHAGVGGFRKPRIGSGQDGWGAAAV